MDDFLQMAYEKRLLVLLENEDHTGFNQVLLDAKQFKAVGDACIVATRKNPDFKEGYDEALINLDDETEIPADLFEGMESIQPE